MLRLAISTTVATMGGALVGSVVHELAHAAAAVGVGGAIVDIGWRGGLTGGPVVIWESPEQSGWEATIVGFAPVAAALIAAVGVAAWRPTDAAGVGAAVGLLLGLLNLSREDVNPAAAKASAE